MVGEGRGGGVSSEVGTLGEIIGTVVGAKIVGAIRSGSPSTVGRKRRFRREVVNISVILVLAAGGDRHTATEGILSRGQPSARWPTRYHGNRQLLGSATRFPGRIAIPD